MEEREENRKRKWGTTEDIHTAVLFWVWLSKSDKSVSLVRKLKPAKYKEIQMDNSSQLGGSITKEIEHWNMMRSRFYSYTSHIITRWYSTNYWNPKVTHIPYLYNKVGQHSISSLFQNSTYMTPIDRVIPSLWRSIGNYPKPIKVLGSAIRYKGTESKFTSIQLIIFNNNH